MNTQTRMTDLLTHTFDGVRDEIAMTLAFNEGFGIDAGKLGERINFVMRDTTGVPSNGGCAFDADDKSEAKGADFTQTTKCLDCDTKNNFYRNTCVACDSTNLKAPGDTRWGIDAKAHFLYFGEIPSYTLTTIVPLNNDADAPEWRIETYAIPADEPFFNAMLQKQIDAGKGAHKNFIPYSRDFYMSSPIHLMTAEVIVGDEVEVSYSHFDPDNTVCEDVMPASRFTKAERETLGVDVDDMVSIADAVEIIGVKESTHGKDRGTLNRNKNH